MPSLRKIASLLTCVLAVSACTTGGPRICPAPTQPQTRPLPAEKLKPANYEQRVRAILFKSQPKPTPTEPGTSPN